MYMKYNKKKNGKKNLSSQQKKTLRLNRPQRGLNPSMHSFKRSFVNTIGLNSGAPPADWYANGNNLYRNWAFSLGQLDDYEDFTSLFKFYRLKAVRVQIYFSNTSSTTRNAGSTASNQQMLMWIDTNKDGSDLAAAGEDDTYLNSQTAKKKLCLTSTGEPLDIYMPLRQQTMVYGGATNTDYTTTTPKWIATTEFSTPHFGHKMMIQRVDGQPFTSGITNSQYAKIIHTVYLECKKVE